MSFELDFTDLTPQLSEKLQDLCIIRRDADAYNQDEIYELYHIDSKKQKIIIPIGLWKLFKSVFPNSIGKISNNSHIQFPKDLYSLSTDPHGFRDQDVITKYTINKLDNDGTCMLALCTGFGKTTIGTFITCHYKQKTMLLCHLSIVNNQWIEAFEECGLRVQFIKNKQKMRPDVDVYVMGILKAKNYSDPLLSTIKLIILDEAHIAVVSSSQVLLRFVGCRYLLGLSATPDRLDDLHVLMYPYFGPIQNYITRQQLKSFTVYKIYTGIVPEIGYQWCQGRKVLNWTKVRNSIEYNSEFHKREVSDVLNHPDRVILLLVSRVEHLESLYELLLKKGENVDVMYGDKNDYDEDCRVLISIDKKAGVGFNRKSTNMLILGFDCTDVRQYEGRIRLDNFIIIDYVHELPTFNKHFENHRKPWYTQRGGTIQTIGKTQMNKSESEFKSLLHPNKNTDNS